MKGFPGGEVPSWISLPLPQTPQYDDPGNEKREKGPMAENLLPGVRLWTAGSGDRPGIEGLT